MFGENSCDHYQVARDVNQTVPIRYSTSMHHDGTGGWVEYTTTKKDKTYGKVSSSPDVYDLRYGTYDSPLVGLPPLYTTSSSGEKRISFVGNLDDLVSASLIAMLPGIKPRLSILNSIYELKDMRTVPYTIRKLKSAMLATIKFQTLFSKAVWKKILRTSVAAVSDSYLQNMFNVRPLISDVENCCSALRSIKKQVESLLHNEGKVQRRHFRRALSQSYPDSDESFTFSNAGTTGDGNCTIRRRVQYTDPVFHATISYSYRIKEIEKVNALLSGYLDALGIFINPKIVWDAIPWSFVVDWFVGIGPFLRDNFSMRNLEPVTHIHSYSCSFKVIRGTHTTLSESDSPFGINCLEVPICDVCEEAYKRFPYAADIYRSLRASGLNLTEFSLSAALAASYASR